jgi:hypothetical protein
VVTTEDIAHGNFVDVVPQVRQCTLETTVAPGRILLSHPHHELFNLHGYSRSSRLLVMRRAITLRGVKSSIPALEGIRRGDGGDIFEAFAIDTMSQNGKAATFGIGEGEPTALTFCFQDAIFFSKIGDDLCLVFIDPTGQSGDEELEDHGITSG